MPYDYRHDVADYYDRFSEPGWDDVAFYRQQLPGPDARVLELGCGTGRVLLPMCEDAGFIYGVDLSPAMLKVCDQKLKDAGVPASSAVTQCADITRLDLTDSQAPFDLVTTPFRVMQNLETDEQIDGLMQTVKRHLAPNGKATLNTFQPRGGFEALAEFWAGRDGSTPCWTKPDGDDTVTMSDDCRVFSNHPARVYPKLIYRRHNAKGELIDESVLDIVMRVWQPDELIALVERHGFTITDKLGGYEGEVWGQGPELVIVFTQ